MVGTPSLRSDSFKFNRGVFQGDPVSPIIFVMTFNPVLFHLQEQAEIIGYNNAHLVTLPYADDFCLITTNLKTNQRIINTIKSHINSMGMRLKPGKCRTFSISHGCAKDVPFYIGDFKIPSIKEEDQKFLGKLLFFSGKAEDTFTLFKDTFKEGLERCEK